MGESKHTPGDWELDGGDPSLVWAGDVLVADYGLNGIGNRPASVDERRANARLGRAAPLMLEAHEANGLDAHDALARLPSTEWVGHAETRDIMALIGKLRERLVAIARRSDSAIKAATGGAAAPKCQRCGHVCPASGRCDACGGDPMDAGDVLCVTCAGAATGGEP